MQQPTSREQAVAQRRTTLTSIAAASALVALKLGVGIAAGSLALISAGVESSGDVLAATLTFFAVRLARQPADREHPYGHARAENLGAIGEAGILLASGVVVAVEAIKRLLASHGAPETGWYVFAVILVALAIDLTRTTVSLRAARRYGSPALYSNALHFAGDMAGSVSVLIGLVLVHAGFEQGDAAAALVIAAIILTTAVRLIAENANVLMDRTPAPAREAAEAALARLAPDIEVRRLRLRESAGRYFADVVAAVLPGEAVVESHQAADAIEHAIQSALPGSDVVVHVEPRRSGLDLRDRVLAVALAEPLVRETHDITIYKHADGTASVSLHLKLPADLDLESALTVARRIEDEIRSDLSVGDVQTHLEPLEQPLAAYSEKHQGEHDNQQKIERIVAERTGNPPRAMRLLNTQNGQIIFLTIGVGTGTALTAAHQLASELEDELHQHLPGIADVVIHTDGGERHPHSR
jgi:cation diffusion facilitator family transporter